MTLRLLFALVLLCGACSAGTPDARAPAGRLVERSRLAMGSSLSVAVWTRDERAAGAALDAAFAEFDRLEGLMSTWVADSDVSRLDRSAGAAPVRVSDEVRDVLVIARQLSEWTGGKFDVTFGALSGLWKFDHDQDNAVPDRRAVQRRLPLIDYRAVRVDEPVGTASIARQGMTVHLGGIGKGYASDRAAGMLRSKGFQDFLIQSGGDLYASGRKDGRPWRLGIRDPRGPADRIFAEIDLSNGTLSTSGDYERAFIEDGRRYHHLLDPATGMPARGARSVTIVTDRAVIADGLSTGVFIMGPAAGMALVERLRDVEAVIVSDRNEVLMSSGLTGRVRIVAAPTSAP